MTANLVKVFLAVAMLALTAFCIFGFLAAFEPGVRNALAWRMGYAVVGTGSFLGAIWFAWAAYLQSRAH